MSDADFRLLSERTGDEFYVLRVQPDLAFEYVSDSAADLVGFTPDEHYADAQRIVDCLDPRDAEALATLMTADVGVPAEAVARWTRPDGRTVWIEHRGINRVREDGSVVFEGSNRDVTARYEAVQELARSERQFRTLTEDLDHIVMRQSPDRRVEYVSPSLTAILGWTPEEFAALPPDDRWHPDDAAAIERARELSKSGLDRPVRGRALCRDMGYRWLELSGRHVRDANGAPLYLVTIARDVQEQVEAEGARADTDRILRLLVEESRDMVAIHEPDGRPVWISPAMTRLFGWDPADRLAGRLPQLFHPEDLEKVEMVRQRLLDGEDSATARVRFLTVDGDYRWVDSTARAVRDDSGAITALNVITRDVHEQVLAEQALVASEERFRLAMAEAPHGMVILALDRTFLEVNPAFCALVDGRADQLVGRSLGDFLVGEENLADLAGRQQLLDGSAETITQEKRIARADGRELLVEHAMALVRDANGVPLSFVSQFRDVTELRAAMAALTELAARDRLTGLFNRGELIDRLQGRLTHARRSGSRVAVLFCDVDNLKKVNDEFGHGVGDELLRAVGERLASAVRATDLVARVGGDEFVVVLDGVRDLADAELLATKIHAAVRSDLEVAGSVLQPGISVGIALAEDGQSVDDMLANADVALYSAKRAGRNRLASYGSGTILPPD